MPMLTVQEAVPILGLSRFQIARLCAAGRIKGARKLGRDWRIPEPVVVIAVKRGRPPKQ